LTNGGDRERASNIRFSSFRRRFSRPLLIVYSRQKPAFDDNDNDKEEEEEEHGDKMLQNVDGPEDPQTTGEETARKDAENVRQKTIHSGQVYIYSDRKKSRGKTGSIMATTTKQHSVDESTEQEVTSLHQQITTESQTNSSLSGGVDRRRVEQNFERQKQGNSSAAASSPKHTEQNRMTIVEVANAPRRPRRRKRGILDNEVDLPDDDMEQSIGGPAPLAGYVNYQRPSPSLLHGPTSQQRVSPASTAGSIYVKHEDTDRLPDSVFNAIRQKGNTREKRRNGRVRGRRRKQSSLMTLLRQPDEFNDSQQSAAADDTCRRKRLRVNFDDIGWGEWIIAPEFFDAFYCDGFCSFPMSRVGQ